MKKAKPVSSDFQVGSIVTVTYEDGEMWIGHVVKKIKRRLIIRYDYLVYEGLHAEVYYDEISCKRGIDLRDDRIVTRIADGEHRDAVNWIDK